jgi:hypothetical protein
MRVWSRRTASQKRPIDRRLASGETDSALGDGSEAVLGGFVIGGRGAIGAI